MRRAGFGVVVWLGLLPFVVGAGPEGGQGATLPAVCPPLPAGGAALIHGLVSGQVLTSGGSLTLRFSNVSYACGSWLTEITSQGCHDDWEFSLTVPASAIQPGVHSLAAIGAQFGELYGVAGTPTNRGGCSDEPCTMSAKGIGSDAVTAQSATLEIDSAGAGCITGTISGLTDVFSDAPDHNGSFFALPCGH